jgi:hypothetical protein
MVCFEHFCACLTDFRMESVDSTGGPSFFRRCSSLALRDHDSYHQTE